MHVDHVIYATADLGDAAARIERDLGVPALPGGRHDGLGTHNMIVPLGGGYLELLAIADAEEAAGSDLGRAVHAAIDLGGERLIGWAVCVDDVRPVAARLGTAVATINRAGLSAHLTGVAEAMAEPYLPFFIARDRGVLDPGTGADAGGITWIEVSGDAARLDAWLGGASLPVRVAAGEPGVLAVGIGARELRTG